MIYCGHECWKMDENSSNFLNQTAAEYSKIHVNFSIFCQDVLFGKLNMIAFSK